MKFKIKLVCLLIPIFMFLFVYAEVPKMINYQGKITTPDGALIDTTVSINFAIYSDSIGSDSLWSETQPSVVVQYGVFSVLLGSLNSIPDSIFDGNVRYLGIKVGDDSEMTPRRVIVSVGYSYHSAVADRITSNDPETGFRRIIQNTTQTTTYDTSWTELASLDVPANEVTAYISIISQVFGVAVKDNVYPGGHSYGEIRITIDGVQQITCIPAFPGDAGDIGGNASETFMTYFYQPTATQKQNGFTIKIEGRRVQVGDAEYQGLARHLQTDIWGI